MKKFGIIVAAILVVLIILFFTSTESVNHEPFYESNYFKTTTARIDNLKKTTLTVSETVQAGFSKISITPQLNNPLDDASKIDFPIDY